MEKEKLIKEADTLIKSNTKLLATIQNKREHEKLALPKARIIELLEQDLVVTALVLKAFVNSDDQLNKYISRFINLGNTLSGITGKTFDQICSDIFKKVL